VRLFKSVVFLGSCCAIIGACSQNNENAGKVSLTGQTAIDSGNVAYRRGDYEAASAFFRQAARAEPKNVAGYYGIYMAEAKLGNKAAADSAHAIVANLAPEMPAGAHPTAQSAAPKNPHAGIDGKPAELPIDKAREQMKKEKPANGHP
jgi:tetratricopeptide (TPR) repeat protein